MTIVEFTNDECPVCAKTCSVPEKLLAEYRDRVRLVVRDFPLQQHKETFKAAQAGEAARPQSVTPSIRSS